MLSIIESILKALVPVGLIGMMAWYVANEALVTTKIYVKLHEQNKVIEAVKLENIQLKQEQMDILKQFTVLTNLSDEQRKELATTRLSEQLTSANEEINKLKEIMVQTPEKAVKIERLKDASEVKFNGLDERIKDLKDLFNMVITTLISFIVLLITINLALVVYIWKQGQRNIKIKN